MFDPLPGCRACSGRTSGGYFESGVDLVWGRGEALLRQSPDRPLGHTVQTPVVTDSPSPDSSMVSYGIIIKIVTFSRHDQHISHPSSHNSTIKPHYNQNNTTITSTSSTTSPEPSALPSRHHYILHPHLFHHPQNDYQLLRNLHAPPRLHTAQVRSLPVPQGRHADERCHLHLHRRRCRTCRLWCHTQDSPPGVDRPAALRCQRHFERQQQQCSRLARLSL
ncbi:hypothetical protein Micbo1qcDRAFT_169192 [Microdochium bolleyi]|uniref:Uncharacterized protein n=1 Tax=Microdochium bolleyi TaxID=196109 RepID=A0A136ILG2_9PEZI|nr:hypothetical protein Micbo1qcDRAFT_169192 [Microdochium bolleyi]